LFVGAIVVIGCLIGAPGSVWGDDPAPAPPTPGPASNNPPRGEPVDKPSDTGSAPATEGTTEEEIVRETATFGAGCFWGVQVAFDRTPGVLETSVGFMGGTVKDVTYKQVCSHETGHAEVVRVIFDPAKVSYEELLRVFWHAHDPTTLDRQGPDIGDQYRSAIFFYSDAQQVAAEKSLGAMQASAEFREVFGDRKIVTEITEAGVYYPAEDYHQKYFERRGMAASCHRGW